MEPVVLDVGSKLVKAGFAYPDQDPSMVFSTAMVKTKDEEPEKSDSEDEELVLEDIVNPISRGIIKDWELMEDLWRYIFYTGLGWEVGNEGQILITEPLLTPKVVREKVVQVMFETFNVTGFYAVEQAVLSLYSVGRISGCAVDVGHGKTDIAPVWEGALQHNCVKRLELGGEDLTKLLLEEFSRNNSERKLDLATAEMLKETVSAVADDYAAIMQDCPVEEHILPDGQVIEVGKERYTIGEAFFQPSLLNVEELSIVESTFRCVSSCVPSENQRQLLENIVVCGGTSTMPGFDARFQKEANLLATPSVRPSLVKPPEYMPENTLRYSAWMGGAILAKVVFPQNQHITKSDYDELGPSIVHKKCY
ncbi:hypothetical protein L7F22_067244 [Adiantum nelumboides]|nr:hypothetical protein [Adiantum nelumboides]